MIYTYQCAQSECDRFDETFEVIKSVKAIDEPEGCPCCKHPAVRVFAPGRPQIMGAGDGWNDQTWNPAFGKVMGGGRRELRKELSEMKAQGKEMIEVGSEPVANMHKHAAAEQARKSNERWRKAARDTGISED